MIFVCGCSPAPTGKGRQWTKEEAWAWYNEQPWLVGCNYLPAYAGNAFEMWQADTFDPDAIDSELQLAEDLGFNIVRVFLHDMLWEQDSEGFLKRIDVFLGIADRHHIKVMPVLFDSCWDPRPQSGKQPDPTPHKHNSIWSQSPHTDLLRTPEKWGKLKKYTQGVIKRYCNDERVLIWDVVNEPGNPNIPAYSEHEPENKAELALKLLEQSFDWIHELKPVQPLTASVWTGEWDMNKERPALNVFALTRSDINQYHSYHDKELMQTQTDKVTAYGRPVICGEYMARTVGNTFAVALPILKKDRIAALNWGFVAGRSQTFYPWETWNKAFTAEPETWFHDIFRSDGTPFDTEEVAFIKAMIASVNGSKPASSQDSSMEPVHLSSPVESIGLDNGLVSMRIVPGLGGRVMQYSLGDYGFFWVNSDLEGKIPPDSRLGPDDGWLNYGGDKLWPSPQGWDGAHQWPGPPDAVLDGGPYAAKIRKSDGGAVAISLTSEEDKVSGIQFSRVIKTFEGSSRVSIDATMKNIDSKPRRWGIWAHTQFDASNRRKEEGYNPDYRAYCPLNRNSVHDKGYVVLLGRPENPAYKPDPDNGLMRVHYQREVGKIGVDSDAGWVATVDGTAGKVFVQRFTFERDKTYPNKASVEFWMNGTGSIKAYNDVLQMPEDEESNPHVFESEVIGPYTELDPGQSTSFHYDWYAASIGGNYPVIDCSEAGVVCELLKAVRQDGKLHVSGRFGTFHKGTVQLIFTKQGQSSSSTRPVGDISPLAPVVLDLTLESGPASDGDKATSVKLVVLDSQGKSAGELAQANIITPGGVNP